MANLNYTTYYLPEGTLSNEDINREFPEWDIDKIARKTGINNRHVAAENEFPLEMSVTVANKLFDEYHIDKSTRYSLSYLGTWLRYLTGLVQVRYRVNPYPSGHRNGTQPRPDGLVIPKRERVGSQHVTN